MMLLFGVVSYKAAILLGRCHMLVFILLDDYRNSYVDLEIKMNFYI